MKELGRAKLLSRDSDEELIIEALAPVEGSAEFRSIAFKESRIDYLFALDDRLSGIVLNNGVTIPVAMPFSELKSRIYDNDFDTGNRIDLTLVTGKPVADEKALRLAKKFNPAAEEPKGEEKSLEISLYAHAEETDRKFRRLKLLESQIAFFEPHAGRKDKETFIQLKPGQSIDGWTKFYVAVPMHHFTYYINQAKNSAQAVLDLCEATRVKETASLKMD